MKQTKIIICSLLTRQKQLMNVDIYKTILYFIHEVFEFYFVLQKFAYLDMVTWKIWSSEQSWGTQWVLCFKYGYIHVRFLKQLLKLISMKKKLWMSYYFKKCFRRKNTNYFFEENELFKVCDKSFWKRIRTRDIILEMLLKILILLRITKYSWRK